MKRQEIINIKQKIARFADVYIPHPAGIIGDPEESLPCPDAIIRKLDAIIQRPDVIIRRSEETIGRSAAIIREVDENIRGPDGTIGINKIDKTMKN